MVPTISHNIVTISPVSGVVTATTVYANGTTYGFTPTPVSVALMEPVQAPNPRGILVAGLDYYNVAMEAVEKLGKSLGVVNTCNDFKEGYKIGKQIMKEQLENNKKDYKVQEDRIVDGTAGAGVIGNHINYSMATNSATANGVLSTSGLGGFAGGVLGVWDVCNDRDRLWG